MPITKKAKKDLVANLTKQISEAKEGIIFGYQGLTVSDLEDLRGKLREQGMTFKIIKNTLLQRIFDDAQIKGIDTKEIKKPLAIVMGDDEVMPAKALAEFSKKHKKLEIIRGTIDKKAVDADQLMALAKLPNREEMLGIVIGTIAAPMSGFVRVLAGSSRSLVLALKAIGESKS